MLYSYDIRYQPARHQRLQKVGVNVGPATHYECIASANTTPRFARHYVIVSLDRGVLLLQATVNMCPAESAGIC